MLLPWDYVSALTELFIESWLVWLTRLSARMWTQGLPVLFPVRAHALVVGQVPSWGPVRGNHTLRFLSFPSTLSRNKKKKKKQLFTDRLYLTSNSHGNNTYYLWLSLTIYSSYFKSPGRKPNSSPDYLKSFFWDFRKILQMNFKSFYGAYYYVILCIFLDIRIYHHCPKVI